MRSPNFIRDRAKTLRRAMTQPEKLLWSLLRRNQSGLHFRRQHPVGPFIFDLYCAAAPAVVRASLLRIDRTERKEGLAVEIDGPVHADRQEHDDRRTAWLAKEDIQVLRFSTTEIETGPAAVLKAIAQAAPPPPPDGGPPPPQAGEEPDCPSAAPLLLVRPATPLVRLDIPQNPC